MVNYSFLVPIIIFLNLPWIFFIYPRLFHSFLSHYSIKTIPAWRHFIIFNIVLILFSPIIMSYLISFNIETPIILFIRNPYLLFLFITLSLVELFIYTNKFGETSKGSTFGLIISTLYLITFWIVILVIPHEFPDEGIILDVVTSITFSLLFNGFTPILEGIKWRDFWHGTFNEGWTYQYLKEIAIKNELYSTVPEFRKKVDEISTRKKWGNCSALIPPTSLDESYHLIQEWVKTKSLIVYTQAPTRIVSRYSFTTANRHNSTTKKLSPTFIDIIITQSIGKNLIELSIYPTEKINRLPRIYEDSIWIIIEDFKAYLRIKIPEVSFS